MNIKRLPETQLKEALTLVGDVFDQFEAPEYSDAGIREFQDFIAIESIIGMFRDGILDFWGCFGPDGILNGVIAVKEHHHISLLFVKEDCHRQGIAKSLFQTVLANCSRLGYQTISVNSSPYAEEAYRHLGFTTTGPEQTVNGIRFIPMLYTIINNDLGD